MRVNTRKVFGEVLTPDWMVDKLLKQAGDLSGKKVADLGANKGQFLQRAMLMYQGVDPNDWILLEVQERYKRWHSRYTGWRVESELTEPVDVLIGNPPYNGGIDLKIILSLKDAGLLKRLVCVHPSTWLVDVKTRLGPKSGSPTFRKFQDAVRDHVTSVELFNGNPVFGIGLFVPCVITDVDFSSARGKSTAINVKDVGSKRFRGVLSIDDVTLHGADWDPSVKEFMGSVQAYCAKHGSLLDSKEVFSSIRKGRSYAQIAGIRGNVSTDTMVQEDFYTFVQKDPEENKGVRNQGDRMPLFSFRTSGERDFFLQYLQTDFARLCLSLLKLKADLDRGEFQLVPWMDFTRSWTDDELFTELGYAKGHPIREYAKRFLPDYHGIYTTKDADGNDVVDKSAY